MAIKFYKLFDLMQRREIKKKDLMSVANISSATMAKLSKNEPINITVVDRLCAALDVQPGDIMEYVRSAADDTSTNDTQPKDLSNS